MTARAHAKAARPPAPSDGADAIGAWLDRLLRLARLPERQSAEIRDELDAHLRERVRDLMLAGHEESEAIHKSISELGDLALLAHRYREAHQTPKGRLVMHTMLVTAIAAALGLSTIALRQSGQPETPEIADEGLPLLGEIPILGYTFRARADGVADEATRLTLRSDAANEPLEVVLAGFGDPADASVFVYWSELEQLGVSPETELSAMPLGGQTVQKALDMISDTLDLNGGMRLDHRVENGLMEIATREFFDQRELELVSYDASALLGANSPLYRSSESETLIQLVTTLVEPEAWDSSGGYSRISVAGNRLFVNAPRRLHERVAWLLAELAQSDAAEEAGNFGHAAPAPGAAAPSRARLQFGSAVEELSHTRGFLLQHTSAHDVAEILDRLLAEIGGSATADPQINSVRVSGGRDAHETAESLIRVLDRPAEADEAASGEAMPSVLIAPAEADGSLVHIAAQDGEVVMDVTAPSGSRQRLVASCDGKLVLDSVDSNGTRQRVEASELQLVNGEVIWGTVRDGRGILVQHPPGAVSRADH